MKIKVSLSEAAKSNIRDSRARSLIKCLYVILLLKTDKMSAERTQILRENSLPAREFLKENRLGSVAFGKLFDAALTKKDIDAIQPQLDAVFKVMREKSKAFSSNSTLTNLYTSIIRDFRSYVQSDNENAYIRLEKNAKETGEIAIYSRLLPAEQDASLYTKALRRIVRKYEPDNGGLVLSLDVAKELREENPDQYKAYLKVRNDLKKAFDKELIAFFRQQHKTLLNVEDVKRYMNSVSMPHNIPEGFVGQIDESGNFYTVRGKTTGGRQLKTKPGGRCFMNPAYDPDKDNTYVLKSKTPGAANETSFYTKDFGAGSQQDKYSKVEENIPHFEEARNKWIRDILRGAGEKFMLAVLSEVSYLSMARIGSKNTNVSNKGDYKGKPTYGIRTLLCKHAKIESNKITISYLGVKTSARLKHYIYRDTPEGKKIFDYIVKRKEAAGPNEPLFVYMGKLISPTKLNDYIKSLGLTITIHKFRTIRGTETFLEKAGKSSILKAKTVSDTKRVTRELDKILEAVGKELGHYSSTPNGTKVTGSTALQYYVIPTYVLHYYDKFKIRYPAKIQKIYEDMTNGKNNGNDD